MKIDYAKKTYGYFSDVNDKDCFYSGGVLYMKISSNDLRAYNIENVNAISIVNAGLTFFYPDEEVILVNKIINK